MIKGVGLFQRLTQNFIYLKLTHPKTTYCVKIWVKNLKIKGRTYMFLKVSEIEAWNLDHCKKIAAVEAVVFDDSNLDPDARTFQLTKNELNTILKDVKYKRPAYGIVFIYSEKKGEEESHFIRFSDKNERDTAFNNLMTDMKTQTITELTPKPHNVMHVANSWLKENQHLVTLGSSAIPKPT